MTEKLTASQLLDHCCRRFACWWGEVARPFLDAGSLGLSHGRNARRLPPPTFPQASAAVRPSNSPSVINASTSCTEIYARESTRQHPTPHHMLLLSMGSISVIFVPIRETSGLPHSGLMVQTPQFLFLLLRLLLDRLAIMQSCLAVLAAAKRTAR